MSEPYKKTPDDSQYNCCTGSLIGSSPDGSVVEVVPLFCHKWQCPRCRKHKAGHWRQVAKSGNPERFITLTLRHEPHKFVYQYVRKIKEAFPKLVKRIRKIHGEFEYLLIFELTKKGVPHVHILSRGGFIPQAWLSKEWAALTGSFIVDIRRIRRKGDISSYITKYMGKAISDVASKLNGYRIIQKSQGFVLTEDPPTSRSHSCSSSSITEWYFCSAHPSRVFQVLTDVSAYRLEQDTRPERWSLRGPPDPDIVFTTIYRAVGTHAFREGQ